MTWQKAPGYSIQILRGTERTYLYENWTNHRQDRVGILHWETTEGFQVVHRKVAARLQVAPRTRTAAKTEIPYAFTFHWVTASDSNSPHGTGLNSPHLHRGHLPPVSNVTGLVKCFIRCSSSHRSHLHPQWLVCQDLLTDPYRSYYSDPFCLFGEAIFKATLRGKFIRL
jgi:hypothetical protein